MFNRLEMQHNAKSTDPFRSKLVEFKLCYGCLQVYVIGGFFILKWAWGRWNEHKERKKSSDDDQPSSTPTTDEGN